MPSRTISQLTSTAVGVRRASGIPVGIPGLGFGGEAANGFSPLSLFSGGEAGGWYDPSDLTAQAQNSDGSTAAAVDSPVGYCEDKSGNGNTVVQAVTANKFTLRQSGSLFYWEGDSGDWLRGAVTTISGVVTVAIAVQFDTTNDFAFDGDANNTFSIANWEGDARAVAVLAGISAPVAESSPAVLLALGNGASSYLRVNGSETTGTIGAVSLDAFTIGAPGDEGTGFRLLGRIYEVIVINRALAAGELTQLESYLAGKSGVTL